MSRKTTLRFRVPALALLMAATAVSGCAFGSRRVNLTYAPSVSPTPTRPATYGRVAVARFDDARNPRQGTGSLLGKVRNGYGIPTASVLANQILYSGSTRVWHAHWSPRDSPWSGSTRRKKPQAHPSCQGT